MEAAIISLLKSNAAVTADVGGRIEPIASAQTDTLPRITIQRLTSSRQGSNSGAGRLAVSTLQINCYAATVLAAKTLADNVRKAIDHYSGVYDTVSFDLIVYADERDLPAIDVAGAARGIYAVALDFRVHFSGE